MNRLVLILVVVAPLQAQFTELATTDDGSRLLFSSTLTLTTAAAEYPENRIFQLTRPNTIQLFAERGPKANTSSFGTGDGARHPQVSGDGSLVAFTLGGTCESEPPCQSPVTRTILQGPAAEASFNSDSAFLSRNGRYLLFTNPPGPPPANITAPSLLRDLQTGKVEEIPSLGGGTPIRRPVASDGTVLTQQVFPALWKAGSSRFVRLPSPIWYSLWGISDNARILLYFRFEPDSYDPNSKYKLIAHNLLTDEESVIISRPISGGPITVLGLSNDGSHVFFRSTDDYASGKAWISPTSSPQPIPVTLNDGELVTEGTLSGDGHWAFAVTTKGRLVKVDASTGSVVETLIPSTPYIGSLTAAAPGSFMSLNGAGLENAQLLLNGSPVPIFRTTPTAIDLQIPWEVQVPAMATVQVVPGSESPFHQNQRVFISSMAPRFDFRPIRPDFSGYFTPGPGDDFVLYATGLGSVDGSLATGQPTPADRLYRITGEFRCRFFPYDSDAELLFAGLAPGYTGIYQLNFRLPNQPGATRITGGSCNYGTNGSGGNIGFATLGNR
ncbi:MAG: hypothetical protein IT168_25810 [Bryobacterales bacterium]|nr:hypothetical protein [Bryobacterales bacterium]